MFELVKVAFVTMGGLYLRFGGLYLHLAIAITVTVIVIIPISKPVFMYFYVAYKSRNLMLKMQCSNYYVIFINWLIDFVRAFRNSCRDFAFVRALLD